MPLNFVEICITTRLSEVLRIVGYERLDVSAFLWFDFSR